MCDTNRADRAGPGARAGKDDVKEARGAALEHGRVAFAGAFDQHIVHGADVLLMGEECVRRLQSEQFLMACFLDGGRDVIGECGGRRARAGAELENKSAGEVHGCHCGACGGEIVVCLAGEADDNIGAEGHIRGGGAQAGDFVKVLSAGVFAVHGAQDAVGTGLQREVDVMTDFRG